MAARVGFSRSTSSGLSKVPAALASAESTLVISCAYGRDASTRAWARAIREVAMSSIALVIFFVDWTERIRRRRSLSCAAIVASLLGSALVDLDRFALDLV